MTSKAASNVCQRFKVQEKAVEQLLEKLRKGKAVSFNARKLGITIDHTFLRGLSKRLATDFNQQNCLDQRVAHRYLEGARLVERACIEAIKDGPSFKVRMSPSYPEIVKKLGF